MHAIVYCEMCIDCITGLDTHPMKTMIATCALEKDKTIRIWEHMGEDEEEDDEDSEGDDSDEEDDEDSEDEA